VVGIHFHIGEKKIPGSGGAGGRTSGGQVRKHFVALDGTRTPGRDTLFHRENRGETGPSLEMTARGRAREVEPERDWPVGRDTSFH
jgi:hypothetical protein